MAMKFESGSVWKLRFLSAVVFIALTSFPTGAECKRSACWRYGHVCWGGHGKRSGQQPIRTPTDSMETVAGSTYFQRSPLSKLTAKQYQQQRQLPLISNSPMINRQQHLLSLDGKGNRQLPSSAVFTLQPDFLQRQPQYPPLPYQQISIMLRRQNERQMYQQPFEFDGMNDLEDDDAVGNNGDYVVAPTDSTEAFTAAPVHTYATGLKRAIIDTRKGTNAGRSTEEPLMTSANGQDSMSGSTATFFRDRKSAKSGSDSLEKEKYISNEEKVGTLSSRRLHQNRVVDNVLPVAQFRAEGIPKARYYY